MHCDDFSNPCLILLDTNKEQISLDILQYLIYNIIIRASLKTPFEKKTAMHDICCVNLPWSAKARLRKLSLQLPHLSVFSLIKRVFRDALKILEDSFIFFIYILLTCPKKAKTKTRQNFKICSHIVIAPPITPCQKDESRKGIYQGRKMQE